MYIDIYIYIYVCIHSVVFSFYHPWLLVLLMQREWRLASTSVHSTRLMLQASKQAIRQSDRPSANKFQHSRNMAQAVDMCYCCKKCW